MPVRPVNIKDASSINDIYNHYIVNTIITFEVESLSLQQMEERIVEISAGHPYLVYEENSTVVGYCYASSWKSRCAYSSTLETTVYVHPDYTGKGIGKALMQELIKSIKQTSTHALIAGISLPNEASIKLHERMGFEKVAHFKQVGRKFNDWIDVGNWELMLNN